jgi:formate dehydrogenase subunit delta
MDRDRLVAMANQIGTFFRAQGDAAVVDGVEDHLRKYWDPRMRREIVAILRQGGEGLAPGVRDAVRRLERASNGA